MSTHRAKLASSGRRPPTFGPLVVTLALLCTGAGAARADEPGQASAGSVRSDPLLNRFHVDATVVADVLSQHWGGEVGGTFSLHPLLDVGLAATVGGKIGGQLSATLHPGSGPKVRPFIQLRGLVQPLSNTLALGASLWLGGTVELGPGRVAAGIAGETYQVSESYRSAALLALAGYQFDFLHVVERVVVKEVEPTPPLPHAHPAGFAVFRGRVLDVAGSPLEGTITFPGATGELKGKVYEAAPEFEVWLPPGKHRVEASAPGHLVRGRTLSVSANETLAHDFQLRPAPSTRSAQLAPGHIDIQRSVQFATNEARILPESFPLLDEVADILLRNPHIARVRIEGHTDDVGGHDFNLRLSEDRAYMVMEYLIARGVEEERLAAQGLGMTKPLASNKTEEGRAQNRRVQFVIVDQR